MERLTERKRNDDGTGISSKSLVIENGMQKGFQSGHCGTIVTKLADYEDLEEQCLLLRLPCRVGDTVYNMVPSRYVKEYHETTVDKIIIDEDGVFLHFESGLMKNINCIGDSVLMYKKEIENALKKGYILVEEVLKTCEYCEFYDWGFCKAILNDENKDGKYIYYKDVKNKPDWCPIHKLPNRKQPEKFTISPLIKEQYTEFNRRWNACLDEILNKNRE